MQGELIGKVPPGRGKDGFQSLPDELALEEGGALLPLRPMWAWVDERCDLDGIYTRWSIFSAKAKTEDFKQRERDGWGECPQMRR